MFDSVRPTLDRLGGRKQAYERLVWGLTLVGCLGLFAGIVVDERLVGTVVYLVAVWIVMGVTFGYPYATDETILDERDTRLHNRASGLTIGIVAMATLSTVPALYVLDAGGYLTIGATLWGAIYAVSALAFLYGACYTIVSRRN
ncbi:DUF2178 domain-containing protein [Halobiforma nitratireducens]|uniref:DUF2178 domain-containing protein n=1 Tax=Halobiforma nitratireducens JCM 10879 TaxID=1227454 RepID=M0LPN9_9EURY|nr:DUF2178 domain-containing protein [Halobiforma nitratireducens]EMA35461.1 hypothetical protein C446_12237 [Halobiforma nitratireducens JCM 10879]